MKITPIMMAIGAVALSACVDPGAASLSGAELVPPSIGANDNLRRGAPPPASASDVKINLVNLEATSDNEISKLRGGALKESALSYGSQMGYARRAWEIAGRLEMNTAPLSTAFDFNRVVSVAPIGAGVIVPPVVSAAEDAFIVNASGTEASVADAYLSILRPGKISPVTPTWRDYLVFTAPTPDEPARSLMPTDAQEKAVFQAAFDSGFAAGRDLADAEFADRMARLQRDFTGMLQYRRLVAQGMMDRMVLADADFGVTGSDGEMRIGNRTVQVTSQAEFQTDPTRWRVRTVSARDALIIESGEVPALSAALR